MALSWYIDAWAPTDGIVFASRRIQASDPWVHDAGEPEMTFAISAPSFEAHPVDRSIAFGATRRGFQERFSTNGETEFGFDSLEKLITFARRIYSGSGPGTMGGGGNEPPPEPGPPSEGPDGAPAWFAREFLEMSLNEMGSSGSELLNAMHDSSPAKRKELLLRAITPEVQKAGARLLIHCAVEAATASFEGGYRLALAATSLVGTPEEWHSLQVFARERDDQIGRYISRRLDWHHYSGAVFSQALSARLGDAMHAPIPVRFVEVLGMPSAVRTMLDVVSYVRADRDFVVRSSLAGLLPLLLAVAANFRAHTAGPAWYDDTSYTKSVDRLIDDCSRFIVDWLPVEELPFELEREVHNWCWRGPRDQRSYKDRLETGGR